MKLWLITIIMALMLAACGGGDNDTNPDGTTNEETAGELGGVNGNDTSGHTADESGSDLGGVDGSTTGNTNGTGGNQDNMGGQRDAQSTDEASAGDNMDTGTTTQGNTTNSNDTGSIANSTPASINTTANVLSSPITIGNVELTQSITSEDGAITVQFPDGWVAESMLGQVVLGNNPVVLESEGMATPEVGVVSISIFGNIASPDTAEVTPVDFLTQFTGQMTGQQETTLGEIQEFDANGRRAATISGTQGTHEIVVTAVEDESGNYVIGLMTGASGTTAQYVEILQAVTGTVAYNPTAAATPGAGAAAATEEAVEAATEESP